MSGEFPAQRATNAENVSIWWRHHVDNSCDLSVLSAISFYFDNPHCTEKYFLSYSKCQQCFQNKNYAYVTRAPLPRYCLVFFLSYRWIDNLILNWIWIKPLVKCILVCNWSAVLDRRWMASHNFSHNRLLAEHSEIQKLSDRFGRGFKGDSFNNSVCSCWWQYYVIMSKRNG